MSVFHSVDGGILHQLIGSLSHYFQVFIHSRWCRISSINSSVPLSLFQSVYCINVVRLSKISVFSAATAPSLVSVPAVLRLRMERRFTCRTRATMLCQSRNSGYGLEKRDTQLDLHLEIIRLLIQQKSPSECNKHLCITSSHTDSPKFPGKIIHPNLHQSNGGPCLRRAAPLESGKVSMCFTGKIAVMIWVWPPPSNSGKLMFIGIPY